MPCFILDTQTFLWWINDSPYLSLKARRVISNINNECLLSLASCWEIAIKVSIGKLHLALSVDQMVNQQLFENDFRLMDITLLHISNVESLPFHHRDPFDRLIIAQSLTEKISVITKDKVFSKYGVKVIW